MECPNCGSTNIKISKSYENSDADGNRGIWMEWILCHNCGYEN